MRDGRQVNKEVSMIIGVRVSELGKIYSEEEAVSTFDVLGRPIGSAVIKRTKLLSHNGIEYIIGSNEDSVGEIYPPISMFMDLEEWFPMESAYEVLIAAGSDVGKSIVGISPEYDVDTRVSDDYLFVEGVLVVSAQQMRRSIGDASSFLNKHFGYTGEVFVYEDYGNN